MTLASVRAALAARPEIDVFVADQSLATVDLAAAAIGVQPGQIAKTLTVTAGDTVVIVVLAGDARLDNAKFRRRFGDKPRFVPADAVEALTGHPPGGVSPVGLVTPLPVYCDEGLRAYARVYPAAGAPDAAFGIAPEELAALAGAEWVDLARD